MSADVGNDKVGTTVQVIDRYSAHQRYRGFATATIRRRRVALTAFQHFIAPVPLLEASPSDVEEFLATRRAARTRHAYRSDLRVFYRWAVDRRLLGTSPAADIESVKVPKSLPRPIPMGDVLGALTWGDRRVRTMIALAAFAGLRCGEIAALRAEDVWLHTAPKMIVVRDGKGGKDRTVPLHPALEPLLSGLPSEGWVFPGVVRPHVSADHASATIRKHLQLCGIGGTPHALRHTFGTELARVSGGDLLLVATLMGHASATTTMGYARLAVDGADMVARMGLAA